MRLLAEVVGFLLIAAAALAVGTVFFALAGLQFGWGLRASSLASLLFLFFVIPGGMNIWILFRGPDGESWFSRAGAGIRGFGILICGAAAAIPLVTQEWRVAPVFWTFALGSVFWWGSIFLEGFAVFMCFDGGKAHSKLDANQEKTE